jgi:hypothetical protein
MITVISDNWYCIRLVQLPRPGISCAAGDQGVGFGQLYADDVRTETVTMQSPPCRSPPALGVGRGPAGHFEPTDRRPPRIRLRGSHLAP